MIDLISRADAMDVIKSLQIILGGKSVFSPNIKDSVLDCLDMLPTVDAEPVRRGRWVMSTEVDESWYNIRMVMRCSECKFPVHIKSGKLYMNYCPNCGAMMNLEATND